MWLCFGENKFKAKTRLFCIFELQYGIVRSRKRGLMEEAVVDMFKGSNQKHD
jgi:hypothetical protein